MGRHSRHTRDYPHRSRRRHSERTDPLRHHRRPRLHIHAQQHETHPPRPLRSPHRRQRVQPGQRHTSRCFPQPVGPQGSNSPQQCEPPQQRLFPLLRHHQHRNPRGCQHLRIQRIPRSLEPVQDMGAESETRFCELVRIQRNTQEQNGILPQLGS